MNTRLLLLSALLSTSLACGEGDGEDTSSETAASSTTSETTNSEAGDGDGDGGSEDETMGGTSPSGPETGEEGGDGDGDSETGGDGDAAQGEELWTTGGHGERCGGCHGNNGQYPPEALAGGLGSEEAIFQQILNGSGYMPPQVPEHLTETEASHVAAYLWQLSGN